MNKLLIATIELITIGLTEIGLDCAVHINCQEKIASQRRPGLVLESGFALLLENGKRLVLEHKGSLEYPMAPERIGSMTKEDNGLLLLENGGVLKLEQSNIQTNG